MQQALINRSVKILSNDGVGVGTGVLIDAQHILTCAHVVDGAFEDSIPLTSDTEIYYLPIGSTANEKKAAKVVYSTFVEIVDGEEQHSFPEFPLDFDDKQLDGVDYSEDLILLKVLRPAVLSLTPILWKRYSDNAEVEGFGFHQSAGHVFKAITLGERLYKLHECRLEEKIPVESGGLKGASGTALLSANSTAENIVGYGMLVAEGIATSQGISTSQGSATSKGIDQAYFIPGEDINRFLASYTELHALSQIPKNGMRLKKGEPKSGSEKDINWFLEENYLSLIDRQFLELVESKLKNRGFVCLTVLATKQDWPDGIGPRVTNNIYVSGESSPRVNRLQIYWSALSQSSSSEEMLEGLLNLILRQLGISPYQHNSLALGEMTQHLFGLFHEVAKDFDRLVIGIKLQNSELSEKEQKAMTSFLLELKQYIKQTSTQVSAKRTQVLLFLVNETQKNNHSTSRARFWDYFRRKNNKALSQLLNELDPEKLWWHENTTPLEPIAETDVDKWFVELEKYRPPNTTLNSNVKVIAQSIVVKAEDVPLSIFKKELREKINKSKPDCN